MKKSQLKKKAFSIVEYMVFIVLLLAAFLTFHKYIIRAFSGRWKGVGTAMGSGRQFDPARTKECAYDPDRGGWFVIDCNGLPGCAVDDPCDAD